MTERKTDVAYELVRFRFGPGGFWKARKRRYPLRADTQRLHQAGVSLSLEGGGGRGAGGAGGELSAGRGGGDGQGHGAGLLLHPLDTKQDTSAQRHHVT